MLVCRWQVREVTSITASSCFPALSEMPLLQLKTNIFDGSWFQLPTRRWLEACELQYWRRRLLSALPDDEIPSPVYHGFSSVRFGAQSVVVRSLRRDGVSEQGCLEVNQLESSRSHHCEPNGQPLKIGRVNLTRAGS